MVCGVKEFGNSDLFHIKFKAHVKEEEMSENERRRSKLSGDVTENNPFLSKLRSRKEKEWHALKGPPWASQAKSTNTVGQPWEYGRGAIQEETDTPTLNTHN